jgi:hypothetical protein
MRAALTKDGLVVNVTECPDEGWTPGDGSDVVEIGKDSPVGVGWSHDGKDFWPPADPAQASRLLWPYEFLSLLHPTEIVALQTSLDPTVIVLRSKLQTLVTPMPFGEGSELHQAVQYLTAAGLLTEERAAEIMEG